MHSILFLQMLINFMLMSIIKKIDQFKEINNKAEKIIRKIQREFCPKYFN